MKNQVTIIPSSELIVVDGIALKLTFSAQENIHAIQWRGEEGHIEFADHSVINETISGDNDYNQHILPYVELWEKEWARQSALQGTPEEITAQAIREERNFRISQTDYLMLPDYPISEQERGAWAAYRMSLREITEQEGFPWKGIEDVPWPVPPA